VIGTARRRLGTVFIVVGLLVLAYGAAVLFWRDPVTDLYSRYQQHKLAGELEHAWPHYRTGRLGADFHGEDAARLAAVQEQVAEAARDFQRRLRDGKPLGRIVIRRMAVRVIFVQGTSWAHDLSKGPGHYEQTSVPGLGRTTAIAGHRTTFGAPFRKIDRLRPGDAIVLELPTGRSATACSRIRSSSRTTGASSGSAASISSSSLPVTRSTALRTAGLSSPGSRR
jgi:sortase A